jgi:hypothetical protein
MLGKLMNFVKAFAQRQQEAAKKAQAQGAEGGQSDVAAKLAEAQAKIKILEANAAQKLHQKNTAFAHEQKRRDIANRANIRRQNAEAVAKTFREGMAPKPEKPKSPLSE